MLAPFVLPPVECIAISAPPGQVLAAEYRHGRVWGLHWHWADEPDPTGGLWRVRIARLAPELKGAFVSFGKGEETGFLDLAGAKKMPHEGQAIVAQLTRPADGGKRLTFKPSARLVGRYLIYSLGKSGIAASRQLADKGAAKALQGLLRSHAEPEEGVVIRAAAASVIKESELVLAELARHRAVWRAAKSRSDLGEIAPPLSLWEQLLIERATTGPVEILAEDDRAFAGMRAAITRWAPTEPIRLALRRQRRFDGSPAAEVFEETMFPQVALEEGGSIWLQPTRACWTVDVDTGRSRARGAGARLAVNCAAAVEIARQVRLRRIGGPVMVDFLRLDRRDQQRAVIADLRAAFAEDPACTQFNDDFDALGLYAFSRQRLGRSLAQSVSGPRRTLLQGLRAYVAQARAEPARRFALVLPPAVATALSASPQAVAQATAALGHGPVVTEDASLAADAFDICVL